MINIVSLIGIFIVLVCILKKPRRGLIESNIFVFGLVLILFGLFLGGRYVALLILWFAIFAIFT